MGNKTESSGPLSYFILLCLINGFGYAYYMTLQTYVLMIELLLGLVGAFLLILEFVIGFTSFGAFKSKL